MPRRAKRQFDKGSEIVGKYASFVFLTTAELISEVQLGDGKKGELRGKFGMVLLNLAELAEELGFREADQLEEISDSFEFNRR